MAEALIGYDELFQQFRAMHVYLIHRSIGMGSRSLKGHPVAILVAGASYGVVREAIHKKEGAL
ncbi:hypothetical protein [Falsirhodobacter sp. 1013]|uniref:hypothetical protein n=1 Tax=Falsirhodobacter sp. 1013 TaxID=3417566 RepID=UPI003EBF32CC